MKGAFSTPVCARKQTNGLPGIDQGFSTGSCNCRHALSARAVPPCTVSQRWSPYKVKGAFSTPVCARKQTNGPPGIDQGFSTGSCNCRHALSARAVPPCTAAMHCQPERCRHALSARAVHPPTSPCPTLSASAEPIFKTDCAN